MKNLLKGTLLATTLFIKDPRILNPIHQESW